MFRIGLMVLFGICSLPVQAADVRTVQPQANPPPARPVAPQKPTMTFHPEALALKGPPCGREESRVGLQHQLTAKERTVVSAYPMIGAIGDTVPVKAKLRIQKTGKPVPRHTLHFRIDGQLVGSAKTDYQGMARVNYKVPDKMGSKLIRVTYNGNRLCMPANASANFGAIKSATHIQLHNSMGGHSPHRGGTYHFRGELTRITDHRSLAGRELLLYLNGRPVRKTATDSGGGFDETVGVLSNAPSTLEVKVQFGGDGLYLPNAGVIHEKVLPPRYTAYLTWTGVKDKVGQTATVTAILSKSYPVMPSQGVAGKTVRIWRERPNTWPKPVPSKSLGSATTNTHGMAKITFKIDDDATLYELNAHADDPSDGFTLVKKSHPSYVVQRAPVSIYLVGPNSGSIGSTVHFKVTVRRTTDGVPVAGAKVRVGYGSTANTDSGGHVTLAYTVSAGSTGPRTLTFRVDEGKRTEAGTKNLPFTVTPNTN